MVGLQLGLVVVFFVFWVMVWYSVWALAVMIMRSKGVISVSNEFRVLVQD